jgi:hypothetical protein
MIFKKVNIAEELKTERKKMASVLDKAQALLNSSSVKDTNILNRLKTGNDDTRELVEIHEEDFENIYTIEQIKTICINYRLRFLDTKYYKYDFPYEAVVKIREFEKRYSTTIKNFRIIAPHKAFELQEQNQDPLLFAEISKNNYYLLHQWGNDLAWYRKFIYFPIRNIFTYFYSVMAAAIIFAFSIPFSWYNVEKDNEFYMRIWFSTHCFIGFFFFIIFLGAIMQTGFSSMNWKSKYMNE